MNLSKREFLQVLSAASVAGMGLGRFAEASAQTAAEGLYDIPRFGNVSFLHITDCHAQLRPIYFREPSVNLGVGDMKGRLPHLVGEHLLKAAGVPAGGAGAQCGPRRWHVRRIAICVRLRPRGAGAGVWVVPVPFARRPDTAIRRRGTRRLLCPPGGGLGTGGADTRTGGALCAGVPACAHRRKPGPHHAKGPM